MEDTGAAIPLEPVRAEEAPARLVLLPRWVAAVQTIAVSSVPTQIVAALVVWFGFGVTFELSTGPTLEFIAAMTFLDTALIALLIRVFLEISGEDSRVVFVGRRSVGREVLLGLAFVPVVFAAVTGMVLLVRAVAPWMQTVAQNPMQEFMRSPFEATVFMAVAMLGGGVREELQRAFILHRFEQRLGGVRWGLASFTLLFGLLHFNQGLDVAFSVGLLGLFWGILYIKRRSAILAMANHVGFNGAQVAQVMLVRALGG